MNYAIERWVHAEQLALTAANLISTLYESDYSRPPVKNLTFLAMRNMMERSDGLAGVKVVYKQEMKDEESGGIYMGQFKRMSQQEAEDLLNLTQSSVENSGLSGSSYSPSYVVHFGTLTLRYNSSTIAGKPRNISRAIVNEGYWTAPYHDCWIVDDWIVSYVVPIVRASSKPVNSHIMGDVYVDVKLERLDINQCSHGNASKPDEFADTHHCHPTSVCEPIVRKGFELGSYRCRCRPGYYRPNASATEQYFDGRRIEDYYKKECPNPTLTKQFACLPCKPECGNCTSGRSCLYEWNFSIRTGLLIVNCLLMVIPIALIVFIVRNRNVRVIRTASFRLLIIILVAVEMLFANVIVEYFKPTLLTCTLREWIEHSAFVLLHGTLFLRVYRIVLIFTTHLSKLAITETKMRDKDLIKKLIVMMGTILLYLCIWTIVEMPEPKKAVTGSGLKFDVCHRSWWHYAVGLFYICLLGWGAFNGFRVRKVPSSYNESKLIILLIYTVLVLYVIFTAIGLFSPSRNNPDNIFIVDFVFCTLRNNSILFFLFANKVYATWKGEGDKDLIRNGFSIDPSTTSQRHESVSGVEQVMEKSEDEERHGIQLEDMQDIHDYTV
jgi:G protein-coupled receptor 158